MKRKRRESHEEKEQATTRPFWSGTITFGLVSVPVDLFPGTRSSHVGLRMLGPEGRPLKRRYFSSETGRELDDNDLVRGYEIQKNKFVVVTDDELEKLAPEKSRDIDLKRFVDISAISPMYFEHTYFLAPASGSTKAYRLLGEVMEKSGHAGIATFVMRGKEYLVAIIAENGVLYAETMRFSGEIRQPSDVGLSGSKKPSKATVHKFETLIERETRRKLSRDALRDDQSEKLESYVKQKRRAHPKEVVETEAPTGKASEAVDIMSILKKSLQDKNKRAA